MNTQSRNSQQGMTLIIGLIMLILMTVMAIASFNIGRISTEIIGNMQQRGEVVAAANGAIQEAVSTTRLTDAPDAIFLNPCAGPNTRCFDTDGDGAADDVTVTLTPTPSCVQAQAIPTASLNFALPTDAACITSVQQGVFATQGVATGNSLCANSVWEVNAVAVDAVTSARVVVTEGVAVRTTAANIATSCPS